MIIKFKGGAGSGNFSHAGRPGKIGGSTNVSMGAKPLAEYMAVVEASPWTSSSRGLGFEPYQYREVPQSGPDSSIYRGLENASRNCQSNYNMTFDEYVKLSEDTFQEQLAASDVYMRITPDNLQLALQTGSFENTFTSKKTGAALKDNKISYKTYIRHRVDGEKVALGVPANADGNKRPIYGYWAKGSGFGESDTWLNQYGSIAVKFDKDRIADELTFTDSDSLDYSDRVRSSDWRKPSILSSYGITNGSYVPDIAARGPEGGIFWEAQIFNHSIANISHVSSKVPMPQSLTDLLDKAGITWSIES